MTADSPLDQKALELCPVCGRAPGGIFVTTYGVQNIECSDGKHSVHAKGSTFEEVVANWNRRAPLTARVPDDVGEVVKELRGYDGKPKRTDVDIERAKKFQAEHVTFGWDQLSWEFAAIRAEAANNTLPCGHHISLRVNSVESDYWYCDLCECRKQRDDALQMETHYRAEVERQADKIVRKDAALRDIEEFTGAAEDDDPMSHVHVVALAALTDKDATEPVERRCCDSGGMFTCRSEDCRDQCKRTAENITEEPAHAAALLTSQSERIRGLEAEVERLKANG